MSRLLNYQTSAQYAQREVTRSREIMTLDLPIVMEDQLAKIIADVTLFSDWVGRTSYQFDVPIRYACLEPSAVILVQAGEYTHRMRIRSTQVQSRSMVRIHAVAEDQSTFDFYSRPAQGPSLRREVDITLGSRLELLDLPALPVDTGGAVLHMAACGNSSAWRGAAVYRSDDAGAN